MNSSIFNERFFDSMESSVQGINNSQTLPPECYAS